jgi:hypothetical protein
MHSLPRSSVWTRLQLSAWQPYMKHEGQEEVRNLKFKRLRGSYFNLQGFDTLWSAKWIPDVSEEYSAVTFRVNGGRITTENLVTAHEANRYRIIHTTTWQKPSIFTVAAVSWDSEWKCACVCVLGASSREEAIQPRRRGRLVTVLK